MAGKRMVKGWLKAGQRLVKGWLKAGQKQVKGWLRDKVIGTLAPGSTRNERYRDEERDKMTRDR